MDIRSLSETVGIDVDTYLVILNVFYEKTVEDMDIIEKAVHECESERAARGAHSIKGAAGTLALDEICALAREIEEKARENLMEEIPPLISLLREKIKPVKEAL